MQGPTIADQLLQLFIDISGWVAAELVERSHMLCVLNLTEDKWVPSCQVKWPQPKNPQTCRSSRLSEGIAAQGPFRYNKHLHLA
jgi:hypothetical protein